MLAKRLAYLDSMRGIAAVVVVISHFALMVPEEIRDPINGLSQAFLSPYNLAIYALLKIHMAARSSVILFFILSGFVLARSLAANPTPHYAYIIKRFYRIYPVLFVTILISYALHQSIGYNHPASSSWLKSVCDIDLSSKSLFKNLLLWGTDGSNTLDGVIWSLVHELRISFFFPLILWTVQRGQLSAVFAWLLISIGCTDYMQEFRFHFIGGYGEPAVWLTWLDTLYFVPFFAGGAWLALNSERVAGRLKQAPGWAVAWIACGCIYCMLKTEPSGLMYGAADYLRGVGCFGLIALAIAFVRFEQALSLRGPVWAGRISYSLYLIHVPIIYALVEWPDNPLSLPVVCVGVLALSLLAAEILAHMVEFPANRFGKFLANWVLSYTRGEHAAAR